MKKLIFPLLLVLAIALTGCGSDSPAPAATNSKNSVPAAAPAEKVDKQDSNSISQTSPKKASKYKLKKDLTDSGKPHQF